ncbi:MAG: NAD(P)/FAD-dependent oxidoreductase [Myxococcota bacterium]|nr:NAD(P)/FAD-dependent oxidoreductase [Myxococcota bacterium]
MHHPAAPYDVDVAVIGGGPAGMSAAVRCRWVKSYRSLPCSVVVFEPGPLGGLAGWRTCSITGPGYRYLGDGLVRRIQTDFDRYAIPVIGERVQAVSKKGPLFILETNAGRTVRALSVVVATGMRPLANERHFLGHGLFVTYMGYEYFPKLMARVAQASGGGVVVFGNRKSVNLVGVIAPLVESASRITWVLDEPADGVAPDLPGTVVRGTLHAVEGHGDAQAGFRAGDAEDPAVPDFEPESKAGVTGVVFEDNDGVLHRLDCSAILLDYNAWETRTRRDWDGLNLADNGEGFVTIDPWCATSMDGVFAAGDITGRYRSTAMALGDGVNAGFSAVRYTHRRKFGGEPNLFAYRSADRPLDGAERDLPEVPEDAWLVPLVDGEHLRAVAASRRPGGVALALDAAVNVTDLRMHVGGDRGVANELIEAWLDAKMMAVHCNPGHP